MSSKIIYSTNSIPGSITNPSTQNFEIKDNSAPFSFLEFITLTKIDYTPEEYNSFYLAYLKEWSEVKNDTSSKKTNYVDSYIKFLQEIVLTYSTNQEKRFLSKLDFYNPADLDIAIPFFVEKIRQIVLFYKEKRDQSKYIVDRNKIRGNNLSIEKALYEKIYEYVFSAYDSPNYTTLGLTLSTLQKSIKINIEEFADVYGNYFDIPPILRPVNQINNLSTDITGLPDDPSIITVDSFESVSALFDLESQLTGNVDVFLTGAGLQTGVPGSGANSGTIVINNTVVGVSTPPNSNIYNPVTNNKDNASTSTNSTGNTGPNTGVLNSNYLQTGNSTGITNGAVGSTGTGSSAGGSTGTAIGTATGTGGGTGTGTASSTGTSTSTGASNNTSTGAGGSTGSSASSTSTDGNSNNIITTGTGTGTGVSVNATGTVNRAGVPVGAAKLVSIPVKTALKSKDIPALQAGIIPVNSATTGNVNTIPTTADASTLNNAPSLHDQQYSSNTNDIDPKLYFPDAAYSDVFGSTAFLQGLPLIVNVDLKYDPICDPDNPLDLLKRDAEEKTGLSSPQIVDLKKQLLSKYMGVDVYYVDTTDGIPVSGVLLTADNPSGNIPNLQTAATPTIPGSQLPPLIQGNNFGAGGFGVGNIDGGGTAGGVGGFGGIPTGAGGIGGLGSVGGLPTGIGGSPVSIGGTGPGIGVGGVGNLPAGIGGIGPGAGLGGAGGLPIGVGGIGPGTGIGGVGGASGFGGVGGLGVSPGVGGQIIGVIDNRPNSNISFGDNEPLNNYGYDADNDDNSGTYFLPSVIGLPTGGASPNLGFNNRGLQDSIRLLRNVGLFFKPDKQGLFKLNTKTFSYSIDYTKLEANKVYIFPDPNVYGNVSNNAQAVYPVVYIIDNRPDVRDISSGFAQGDPFVRNDEQTFSPYYAREQSNEKQLTNVDGLNLNFTDLYNAGYITKIQYDVFGNEYALFKDSFGQTFKNISQNTSERVVSKMFNGHVFYDIYEGYNFNYDQSFANGETIKPGIATCTSNTILSGLSSNSWSFTVSGHPLTLFFRDFILYQELLEEQRRIVPAFKDGGRFTFLDSFALPDPLDSDDFSFPSPSNYFYEELVDAGISKRTILYPPRPTNMHIETEIYSDDIQTEFELDIETEQTDADFTIDVRFLLSANNVEDYDCGYFTDNLTLQNDYEYGSRFKYYNDVSKDSETILSNLSATRGYITQADRDLLEGKFYVKNQSYSFAQPVSTALTTIFGKYNNNVKGEIYSGTHDIDIIYDTIIAETDSYLVFDKINYEDEKFISPNTKNTVYKILSSSYLNKFSNRFFHEDKRNIVFAIVSPFVYHDIATVGATDSDTPIITQGEEPMFIEYYNTRYLPISRLTDSYYIDIEDSNYYDNYSIVISQSSTALEAFPVTTTLSGGNNKVIMPNIYEYNIKTNTTRKIFPLGTQGNELSSFFSLEPSFTDITNFNIVKINKPALTYNSLNDVYKLSYIGVDNNNLFHILDYTFFINNDGEVEFSKGSYYQHDKIIRTTDLLTSKTSPASAFRVAGDYTISNGKLII